MAHGGARPGAGKPKGHKLPKTIEREEARKQMQAYILKQLEPLLQAQASLARGLQFVYKIVEHQDDKGKVYKREHIQVTDPEEIKLALDTIEGIGVNQSEEYYYLTSKAPDIRAVDSMLDRVFGRATQSLEFDNPAQNEELKSINKKLKEMYTNVKSRKSKAKN